MKSIMSHHESPVFSSTEPTGKKTNRIFFPKFKLFVTIWLNLLLKNTIKCQCSSSITRQLGLCLNSQLCGWKQTYLPNTASIPKKSVIDSWHAWLLELLVLEFLCTGSGEGQAWKLTSHWRILRCMKAHSAGTKQPTQGEVTPLPETHPCQGTPMWVGKDKAGKRTAASHSETSSPPHPRHKPQSDPPVTFCGFWGAASSLAVSETASSPNKVSQSNSLCCRLAWLR